ncbi:MAG: histidine phosphatase family protein [Nocardioides sp.]|nr:histidine phosphatase family protein [Nocardioides sp.]
MATVILARHGRSTANTGGILAGRSKGVHLDDDGAAQARAMGERLTGLPLAAVVTSPLERCRETVRGVLAGHAADVGVPVHREKGLLECDYGAWTGREIKALAKEPLWRTVQTHPSAAVFPEGESLAAMSARGVEAVRRWDRRVEDEHGADAVWVAVSHGDLIKAVLADALGLHLDEFQRIMVDPGSFSVVRYTPHRAVILTMNSAAGSFTHLAPPPRQRKRRARASDGDGVVGGSTGTRS